MTTSQLCVTKLDGSLVVPCEPTPSHSLPLSAIDRVPILGVFVEVFMVYKHGHEAAKVIKQALRKALVYYYPLAGRFIRSEQGEVQVACTGEGVWFVEASADRSLEDMGWLDQPPLMIPKDQLLPLPPNPSGMSFMMQVTQFTCGGFVVGLMFDHTITDGIGFCQILKAIGEISRGLEQPLVKPIWSREHIPNPPLLPRSPLIVPCMRLELLIVDVYLDQINKLKHQFMEQMGERCSAFDVAMAKLWQSRTRAIALEPGVDVRLQFLVNTRHLLSHVLPSGGGYYGNCVYPVTATAPSGKVANGSIAEIVTLIRDAKESSVDEFSKWAAGDLEEDPYIQEALGYESMGISDWTQLGSTEIDFGWGRPAYYAPVPPPPELELRPMGIVVKPPAPKEGYRLMTICVKKEHLEAFHDEMMKGKFGLAQPPKKLIHAKM